MPNSCVDHGIYLASSLACESPVASAPNYVGTMKTLIERQWGKLKHHPYVAENRRLGLFRAFREGGRWGCRGVVSSLGRVFARGGEGVGLNALKKSCEGVFVCF